MNISDLVSASDAVGKVVNGNAAGFFVLLGAVVCLGFVVRRLWKNTEKHNEETRALNTQMRKDLEDCRKGHANCEAQNRVLTQAFLDHVQGRTHAAQARAETLLEIRG